MSVQAQTADKLNHNIQIVNNTMQIRYKTATRVALIGKKLFDYYYDYYHGYY